MAEKHIIPRIGNIKLLKLDPLRLTRLDSSLAKDGVGARRCQMVHNFLHKLLADAVRWNLIPANPAALVDRPRWERAERSLWTPEQISVFLASIQAGNCGQYGNLLGFLLASITLLSSTKAPALLALLIPMLAVGLPLFEILFAFLRRTLHGQHPFRGDRRHLHHRFLALGLTEKRTVLTFYYITAYLGVTAYVLQRLEARATMALVVIIALGMLLLVENMRYLEHKHPKP
jgi:UDP-GlcNAc:undecaprenyl-phosphate GlcNAc-1-phosphate transferase